MVKTTSEASATARGLSAQAAPKDKSFSALALVRLNTVAAKPARIKCPHMLAPITPVPIQPMRVLPGEILIIKTSLHYKIHHFTRDNDHFNDFFAG